MVHAAGRDYERSRRWRCQYDLRVGVLRRHPIGIILAHRHLGFDLSGQESAIVDGVVGILTALGVYGFKNETPA